MPRLGPLSQLHPQKWTRSASFKLKSSLLPATFCPTIYCTVAHREVSRIPNPSNYQAPNQLSSSAKRLMLEQPAFSPGNLFPIILFGTLPPHLEYLGAAPLV
jgi:hypothetical protein